MAHHDVVVIGASSGGVTALTKVLGALPDTLQAAVFVVLHVPPDSTSHLPAILNRAGNLPAAHAVDHERIRRSRVYVAPPGQQTYLHRGHVSVRRGPKENLHRPAIDPLFRTAAHQYGPRVIGVILSGAMDDGAAGMAAVKQAGGIAIVQAPDDADFPSMPTNALDATTVDYSIPSSDIGALITELVGVGADLGVEVIPSEVALESREEAEHDDEAHTTEELGVVAPFTCPDCHGTLWQITDDGPVRYRCRVGHAFSQDTIVKAQGDAVERALWTAFRALEERSALLRRMAELARGRGHHRVATNFDARVSQTQHDAQALHEVILNGGALEPVGDGET